MTMRSVLVLPLTASPGGTALAHAVVPTMTAASAARCSNVVMVPPRDGPLQKTQPGARVSLTRRSEFSQSVSARTETMPPSAVTAYPRPSGPQRGACTRPAPLQLPTTVPSAV